MVQSLQSHCRRNPSAFLVEEVSNREISWLGLEPMRIAAKLTMDFDNYIYIFKNAVYIFAS
jgi:hypothetical protein